MTISQQTMRRRFWRIVMTQLSIVLHVFFYDIVFARWFRASTTRRWVRLAERFRALAVELGGVPIKMGQFLSVRVDVLPSAVTSVLAELRDAVPAVPFAQIAPILHEAWGSERIEIRDTTPVAAASLGQVYRGRRRDDGRDVAVKVLRPQIRTIIETDLAAVQFVVRLIKDYPLIRRRVDMQRVYDEFAVVLREELDYRVEAANNIRLRAVLAADPRVTLPTVHTDLSSDTVLVMDWIDGIAPDNTTALDAAGIDRSQLARAMLDIFFVQCFEHGVFHADPHPGNMVIVPGHNGQWQLFLLDLGAIATVPARLQRQLRKGIIAIAANDVIGTVDALDAMGMLMGDADHAVVRVAIARVLDEVFDRSVAELRDIDVVALSYELRDVFLTLPFQLPQDVIYLGRTLSLLSGVISILDPQIKYFEAVQPIAQRWLTQRQGSLIDNALRIGRQLLGVPGRIDRVLLALENGNLRVDMRSMERYLQRMEQRAARTERILLAVIIAAAGYMVWWWGR